jgi:hypothetical protein
MFLFRQAIKAEKERNEKNFEFRVFDGFLEQVFFGCHDSAASTSNEISRFQRRITSTIDVYIWPAP